MMNGASVMPDVEEAGAINVAAVFNADPLLAKVELPLRSTFYPLGFAVELSTNSPAVIEAAETSWGRFKQKFAHPPLEVRFGVTKGGNHSSSLPPVPVLRLQGSQLVSIADAHNFFAVDFNIGRAFGWITQATAEAPLYFRHYLLNSAFFSMISALRAGCLHAACVAPLGHGMLLCGNTGAGKSTLAYAGARAGWTLVSDDASFLPLDRDDRLVVGNSHRIRFRSCAVKLFPELEGHPVIPYTAGKPAIELPTAEVPELTTADSAEVENLIFINRNWTSDPELAPLSRETVLPWVKRSLTFAAINSQAVQDNAIRRLFDAGVYELRYRNLDWAIERLQKLALTGK
jgi:hypothetical protein